MAFYRAPKTPRPEGHGSPVGQRLFSHLQQHHTFAEVGEDPATKTDGVPV